MSNDELRRICKFLVYNCVKEPIFLGPDPQFVVNVTSLCSFFVKELGVPEEEVANWTNHYADQRDMGNEEDEAE